MSTQERLKILEMISQGKLTAEEGARLLDAAGTDTPKVSVPQKAERKPTVPLVLRSPDGQSRRLRIKVVEDSGTRVNVNLPLTLMEVGLRIGGRFVPELQDMENEMQLLIDAIANDMTGKIVEVDDEDSHVEIFIE